MVAAAAVAAVAAAAAAEICALYLSTGMAISPAMQRVDIAYHTGRISIHCSLVHRCKKK